MPIKINTSKWVFTVINFLPALYIIFVEIFLSLSQPQLNTMSTGGIFRYQIYNNLLNSLSLAIFLYIVSVFVRSLYSLKNSIDQSNRLQATINLIFSIFLATLFFVSLLDYIVFLVYIYLVAPIIILISLINFISKFYSANLQSDGNNLSKKELNQMEQDVVSQGYELAVDCFIINDQNQVFAQKRSMDRRLYPGCWDFPGGHVDPGDSLYNTIFKEVKEELNLEVDQILYLFDKVEWIIPDNSLRSGENPKKMILQFVITVKTMEGLKLEEGKAVDWKWIDESNLEILKEGRPDGEEDIYTYDSVKKLLESL